MTRSKVLRLAVLLLSCGFGAGRLHAQTTHPDLREDARRALKKAARYYHDQVASHGGYVYYTSLDLQERWGEGKASPDTIFVQPPGTPTVGMAYLKAYAATRDKSHLDAAREAAEALVQGQLQSGGWTQVIHFAPAKRTDRYRKGQGKGQGGRNVSSLDDGQTQAALRMLILADETLGFEHAAIHEAAAYGLDALLAAQFPNGGFPQVWTGPVPSRPIVPAKFPPYDWKTEGRIKNYWDFYTLNDGLAGTVSDTLIEAHRVYKDGKYKAALEKLGDFLVLAQMPEPQPGWCQQYNAEMVPIWARKFEPPAVSGWESQDVLETLIKISRVTGKKKYLEPIPRALAYLEKSLLADGTIARYHEFGTNKPLYMDADYQLTYDDAHAPSHYGWKQPARFAAIEQAYQEALHIAGAGADTNTPRPRSVAELEKAVVGILRDLDEQGRWVSTYAGERLVGQPKFRPSFRYLSSEVFSRNVEVLSAYIAAGGKK